MEEKKGNPYHAKDGKFTSKEGQGQGGTEEKVINQMGLNKEDTDRQIASDFAQGLSNGGRIFFAGKDIGLDNIDEFTDVEGSLEEKLYDIVSKETNYEGTKEPAKMPELENIKSSFDKIMARAQEIIDKRKAQEPKVEEPKIEDPNQKFEEAIKKEQNFSKIFGLERTKEDMARAIANDLSPEYGSFEEIQKKALDKLSEEESYENVLKARKEKDAKETELWKKAGYEERMAETPQEIELTDEEGRTRTVDVDWNDYVDFMKSFGVKLTEDQIWNLKENWVLPYDIFDEDTFEDFKDYIKDKK